MLEARLRLPNIFWEGDTFQPDLNSSDSNELELRLAEVHGQFSLASESQDGAIILIRDKYGINKLFFGIRGNNDVVVANYAKDLLDAGLGFDDIYSVPLGHFTVILPERRQLTVRRYHDVDRDCAEESLPRAAQQVRKSLDLWFDRFERQFGDRHICLCLSGGIDSGLIAALASRRRFAGITAFTYSYVAPGHEQSEDARYAAQLAAHLQIPLRIVPATKWEILSAVDEALVYGQDWRDFNVHCAVVNELLGRAISAVTRHDELGKPLLLTGDMMNEIMVDYTPIDYRGDTYYPLPDLEIAQLRKVLIKGLDAGDREVGVFGHHGLDVLQPYGLVAGEYMKVSARFLENRGAKQSFAKQVAGDLLPAFILNRAKVRAQIGDSDAPTGILPILVDAGRDSTWLRQTWKRHFGVQSDRSLSRFLRAGMYRVPTAYPTQRD